MVIQSSIRGKPLTALIVHLLGEASGHLRQLKYVHVAFALGFDHNSGVSALERGLPIGVSVSRGSTLLNILQVSYSSMFNLRLKLMT